MQYGRLVDLGRELLELRPPAPPRPRRERWLRAALGTVATRRALFTPLVRAGQALRRILPSPFAALLPPRPRRTDRATTARPARHDGRRVTLLTGCVQPALAPQVDAAASRVLQRLGFTLVPAGAIGCCGALDHHMGHHDPAMRLARANIAAWTREIEGEGLDAIVINASGCGTTVKDYGHLLARVEGYAERARRVAEITRDVTEFLASYDLGPPRRWSSLRVAYHSACSMQHGQRITEEPKALLRKAGFTVLDVPEAHICCGSAGVYNILQPELAAALKARKQKNIARTAPDIVAAGNIGCLTQLRDGLDAPLLHTVELLDWATGGPTPEALRGALN